MSLKVGTKTKYTSGHAPKPTEPVVLFVRHGCPGAYLCTWLLSCWSSLRSYSSDWL